MKLRLPFFKIPLNGKTRLPSGFTDNCNRVAKLFSSTNVVIKAGETNMIFAALRNHIHFTEIVLKTLNKSLRFQLLMFYPKISVLPLLDLHCQVYAAVERIEETVPCDEC